MSIGHKRDREPGRVPVNMLKRVSQKAESYGVMYEPIEENLPKSSKVHRLIKNVATRRKSRHETSAKLV